MKQAVRSFTILFSAMVTLTACGDMAVDLKTGALLVADDVGNVIWRVNAQR